MAVVTRVSYTNLVDSATVTGSTEVTNLEDDNIKDNFVAFPWRTTGDSDENIVIDLGSAQQVTVCGIFGHNFSSGATVHLEAHTADSWGTPAYGPTTLTLVTDPLSDVLPKIVFFLDQTYRYWRIRVQDASNADGYLEIGRVWLGTYWTPTYNFSNGFQVDVVKPDKISRAVLSGAYGREMPSYEQLSFGWNATRNPLGTTDRETLEAIYRAKGLSKPIFLTHDATNLPTKTGIYGFFTNGQLGRTHGVTTNFGSEGLVLREDVGWNYV